MAGNVKIIFSAEVNAALAAIQGFQRNALGLLTGIAEGVAAGFSVRALVNFIDRQIDVADQAGKTAQKIGFSVEAFSAYAYAADLANVENGEFIIGMKTLAQQVADAARGQAQAVASFAQLSLGVTNADGSLRSLEEVLPQIADRFAEMPDGVLKTDLAVQLFGRSGIALIPMLNEGSAGLARLVDEARKAGVVISAETSVAADEFNDTLSRVRAQVNGLGLSLAQELLPHLQAAADRMLAFTSNAEGKQETVTALAGVLKGLGAVVASVGVCVNALGRQLGINLALGFEQIVDGATSAVRVFKLWYESMGNVLSRVIRLGLSITSLGTALRALASGDMAGFKQAAGEFREQSADAIKGLGADFADAWKAQLDNAEGFLKRSATRAGVWWDETKDNVLSSWSIITGTFDTLFGPKKPEMLGPVAQPGWNKRGGGIAAPANPENDKQIRAQLDQINREYEQAFLAKSALLSADYERELSALDAAARLRGETLADEQVFERARFQLRETYAQKRAALEQEKERDAAAMKLDQIGTDISQVESNPFANQAEKQAQIIPLLQRQNQLLDEQIVLEQARVLASSNDDEKIEREKRLLDLQQQRISVAGKLRDVEMTNFSGALRRNVVELQDEAGNVGNVWNTVFDGMRASADTLGQGIAGLIDGTTNWGQSFMQTGQRIIAQISSIFAEMIANKFAMAVVDTVLSQRRNVENTKTAATGAVAGLGVAGAEGGWYGVIIYALAYAAALAAITGLVASATGGFARGGIVSGPGSGTSDSIPARLSNGEFVVTAEATARNRSLLEALNSGRMDVARMAAPFTSSSSQIQSEAPGLGSGGGGQPVSNPNVNVQGHTMVLLRDQSELRAYLESHDARNLIIQHVREGRVDLGMST